MNKVGSTSSSPYTGQIPGAETNEQIKSPVQSPGESPITLDKSVKQEAKTRESDSDLQASVRKETLFAQVDKPKTGGASEAKFVERNLKSDAEVRKFATEKAFPAIMKGLEKSGLGTTEETCNLAAGMLMTALKKQGIEGAKIRFTANHAFVEVPTKKGTLILDPTAGQFFKEGSEIKSKLKAEGFVGTKEELKKTIRENIMDWKHESNLEFHPNVVKVIQGERMDKESTRVAEAQIDDLAHVAELRYFSGVDYSGPGDDAIKQHEWYEKGDLDQPFINKLKSDMGPTLKTAYETMEKELLK